MRFFYIFLLFFYFYFYLPKPLFFIFVFNFICFLFIKEGIKRLIKNEKIVNKAYPLFVILVNYISTFIFKNNTLANDFVTYRFGYFMGIFFFIIPLITFIFIKKSKK